MKKDDFNYVRTLHKEGYQNFAKIVSFISIFGIYVANGSPLPLLFFSASLIFLLLAFLTSILSVEFLLLKKPRLYTQFNSATKVLNLLTLIFTIFGVAVIGRAL
jgi:hypothetical protein